MSWYDVEDSMRSLPFFADNTVPFNTAEARYKRPAKTFIDQKKLVNGQFAYVSTKRELYDDYKKWMRITAESLGMSAVSFLAAGVLCLLFISSPNALLGLLVVGLAWFSGLKYRHAVGKYGNIKDFEDMPVVLPIMNLYQDCGKNADMDWRPVSSGSSHDIGEKAAAALKK